MMRLSRLKPLYEDMKHLDESRVSFSYRNNRARVEVVFIIDERPFKLLIAARGMTRAVLEIAVNPGFLINTYVGGDGYNTLLDALGVESNPSNRFSTNKFFADMNDHIPARVSESNSPSTAQMAIFRPDFEERDKIYWLGWVLHRTDRRVTAENLEKTRCLLGETAYRHCFRLNISSRWTADAAQQRRVFPPPSEGCSIPLAEPDKE